MTTRIDIDEIIYHAQEIQSIALNFTHPVFEHIYPEMHEIFSRSKRIEELCNELR